MVVDIDIDGKPHASHFAERDTSLVIRAAELMGFHVIQLAPDSEELHRLAKALPRGKTSATGRAFEVRPFGV